MIVAAPLADLAASSTARRALVATPTD